MNNILIIGQAPPIQEQVAPYDTTLLYHILEWVGVTKERAQELFEFEAMTPNLRGVNKNGGHLKPLIGEQQAHYNNVLKAKIESAQHVLLMGRCSVDFFMKGTAFFTTQEKFTALPHPSRRNYNLIMLHKDSFINTLTQIL